MEETDRRDLPAWFVNLLKQLGDELMEELCEEVHRGSLFNTPLHPVVAALLGYQDQPHVGSYTLRDIMEVVHEVRQETGLQEVRRETRLCAILRRIGKKLWARRWYCRWSSGIPFIH